MGAIRLLAAMAGQHVIGRAAINSGTRVLEA